MFLILLSAFATAQTAPPVDAAVFRPSIDSRSMVWTDDATMYDVGDSSARVGVHYFNGTIAAVDEDGTELQGIDNALAFDLAGALYFDVLRVGVHVPVYGMVTSDVWQGGMGIGDVSLDGKLVVLDPVDTGVGLGFSAKLGIPNATFGNLPVGNDGLSWSAGAIVDVRQGPLQVSANLGTIGLPKVEVANLELDDAFYGRLGAGYATGDRAGLSAEGGIQVGYKGGFANGPGTPAEALLGGWFRPTDGIVLRGAAGTGLTRGIGSPAIRALISVSFEPAPFVDTDMDGIIDAEDACLAEAEDFDGFKDADGCPEDDNDSDGISDRDDSCALEPEDYDDIEDDDGCPDAATWMTVTAALGEQRPIADARITLARGDEVVELTHGQRAIVQPGEWTLQVGGDKLATAVEELTIQPNVPIEREVVLTAAEGYRLVTVRITDRENVPIDAQWTLTNDLLSYEAKAGLSVVPLPLGSHPVSITAFGYTDGSATIEVTQDGEGPALSVVLRPAWGSVNLLLVDPDGNPIEGTWFYRDEPDLPPIPIPKDGLPNFMQEGDHIVLVKSAGFKDAFVPIRVLREDMTMVEWTMEPGEGAVLPDGSEQEKERDPAPPQAP